MRRRLADESGQAMILTAVFIGMLIVSVGLVVDVGHAMLVQRQLQAGVDAGALAGVQHLPNKVLAENTAVDYSATPGERNAVNTVDNAVTTATATCLAGVPGCNRRDGGLNGVIVRSTSTVPTWFGRIVGISQMKVSAKATACSPCSVKPLDVMLVIDRTGSMCHDAVTGRDEFPRCEKLDEAKRGVQTFLGLMDPSLDRVGLAFLPPVLDDSWRSSCPWPNGWGSNGYRPWSGIPNRNAAPGTQEFGYDGKFWAYDAWWPAWDLTGSLGATPSEYVVASLEGADGNLADDYLVPDGQGGWRLNPLSAVVQRLGCASAGGSTSYSLAVESAQHELIDHGRPGVKNVIIFLSDGAANTSPMSIPQLHWSTQYQSAPCAAGVHSASLAKGAGTAVYTIGYGLSVAGSSPERCMQPDPNNGHNTGNTPEGGGITSFSALRAMATSPVQFYNAPGTADLEDLFRQIATDLSGSRGRLIDNTSPNLFPPP